jgi:hypothetical protein
MGNRNGYGNHHGLNINRLIIELLALIIQPHHESATFSFYHFSYSIFHRV